MTSRDFALRSLCVLVAATSASVLVAAPGCSFFDWADDCERTATCPPGTVGNDGGTDGGDGGDSGPPTSCIPSANSTPVADTCGVFVSSTTGDDTNGKGTQKPPYKTLAKALEKATTVYACAGRAVHGGGDRHAGDALRCARLRDVGVRGGEQDAAHGGGECGAADAGEPGERGERDPGPRLRDHRRWMRRTPADRRWRWSMIRRTCCSRTWT